MSTSFGTEPCLRPVLRWRTTPGGVMQAIVMHALQLRRACRETFILCDIQGCSITETAAILGISTDAVIRRLKRARRQMDDVVMRLCEPASLVQSDVAKDEPLLPGKHAKADGGANALPSLFTHVLQPSSPPGMEKRWQKSILAAR